MALTATGWMTWSTLAHAQGCGVEAVVEDGREVQVQFSADHRIETGMGRWQRDGQQPPRALSLSAGSATVEGLRLTRLSLGPGGSIVDSWEHGRCRIRYAVHNGQPGIHWQVDAALPGLPPAHHEGFIAASAR